MIAKITSRSCAILDTKSLSKLVSVFAAAFSNVFNVKSSTSSAAYFVTMCRKIPFAALITHNGMMFPYAAVWPLRFTRTFAWVLAVICDTFGIFVFISTSLNNLFYVDLVSILAKCSLLARSSKCFSHSSLLM